MSFQLNYIRNPASAGASFFSSRDRQRKLNAFSYVRILCTCPETEETFCFNIRFQRLLILPESGTFFWESSWLIDAEVHHALLVLQVCTVEPLIYESGTWRVSAPSWCTLVGSLSDDPKRVQPIWFEANAGHGQSAIMAL